MAAILQLKPIMNVPADRRASAHGELKRWLAGDHRSNNDFRHAEAA